MFFKPSRSSMIGKLLVLQISEPWDFKSPDGSNELVAEIESVDRWGRVLFARTPEDVCLPEEKLTGRRLRVDPRYVGHRLSALAAGRRVVVGIGVIEDGKSDAEATYAFIALAFLRGFENGRVLD